MEGRWHDESSVTETKSDCYDRSYGGHVFCINQPDDREYGDATNYFFAGRHGILLLGHHDLHAHVHYFYCIGRQIVRYLRKKAFFAQRDRDLHDRLLLNRLIIRYCPNDYIPRYSGRWRRYSNVYYSYSRR
ncbi:hypothetical protein D3C85_1507570 [compost metagenome]